MGFRGFREPTIFDTPNTEAGYTPLASWGRTWAANQQVNLAGVQGQVGSWPQSLKDLGFRVWGSGHSILKPEP